jgi:NADPH2:quinone reductase
MHVIHQYEFGGPEVLRYEQGRDLEPGSGQVRIAVNAIGVHLIDASIRRGEEFGSLPVPTLPMTPGERSPGSSTGSVRGSSSPGSANVPSSTSVR